MSIMIHKTSEVQANVIIGEGSNIWQYVVVMSDVVIGKDANICSHCFIENDVIMGDRVTVKFGVVVGSGSRIGNDVFIGSHVAFTNNKFPRSKQHPEKYLPMVIEDGASIGGGAVLLGGITIGKGAMVGAGAVVTKSVPPYAIVTGSPARVVGYMGETSKSLSVSENLQNLTAEKPLVRVGVGSVTLHRLKLMEDVRGDLSIGEFSKDIPFEPKRYFVVTNVPGEKIRGEHAHHKCHQFLVCVKGSCAVVVDDGQSRCEVLLNSADRGIYLPPLTWGTQYKYSDDAVLLVFASDYYEASDYIHDYTEFVALASKEHNYEAITA